MCLLELDLGYVVNEPQSREAPQQRRVSDPHFHAGQRGAEAVMDSVPERQMAWLATTDVERVGRLDEAWITIAYRHRQQHELACGNGDSIDLDISGGHSRYRCLHHRQVAQQFLDRRAHRVGGVADRGKLFSML